MPVVRKLVVLGALSAMAGASGLLMGGGCTTFGEEPAEGGTSPEGSTTDGPTGADVGVVPPSNVVCDGGGAPMTFTPGAPEDLVAVPPTEVNGGKVTVTPSPEGVIVTARGTPPLDMNGGVRAFASWGRELTPAVSQADLALDFDVGASYGGAKLYMEGGCRVSLIAQGGAKTTAQLVVNAGKVFLGGRETGNGKVDKTYREDNSLVDLSKIVPGQPAHVRFELGIRAGALQVSAAVDSKKSKINVALPGSIERITVDCGIVYADNSDAKALQVEARNIVMSACP